MTRNSIVDVMVWMDLYELANPEDGSPQTYKAFTVVVEDEAGYRWAHELTFDQGRKWGYESDEDGGYDFIVGFQDAKVQEAKAEKLAEKVRAAGGPKDWSRWTAIAPAYGSRAYEAHEAEEADDETRGALEAEGRYNEAYALPINFVPNR
jgi:hypothetical protein